jgi:type IV pilus assembly protein PilY1
MINKFMQLNLMRSAMHWLLGLALTLFGHTSWAQSTTVDLSQTPLLALKTTPGLVMLTMSRDHRLFYSAYNDTSDISGDGAIDVGFKPAISYYGYFATDRCYSYDSTVTPKRFVPNAFASTTDGCLTKTGRWNGNWLNWALTSRMDALRKVLYGGYRQTDDSTRTVLEAAHIPGDSHVWGKEFRPTSEGGPDAYNITYYTPLPMPAAGKMHILLVKSEGNLSTVYTNRQVPTLRVVESVDSQIDRVWLWSSSERPIAGANGTLTYHRNAGKLNNGLPGEQSSGTPYVAADFNYRVMDGTFRVAEVRVETCVAISGLREPGCTGYPKSAPTKWKPTGVLHDYGESDNLKFGLLTGSYTNNYSGGVVRKDIGSFTNEVDPATGQFTSVVGIVKTIDRITTYGYNGTSTSSGAGAAGGAYAYDCGFNFASLRTQGQCQMWGAPVAEMMFEGLRYFAAKTPASAFTANVSDSTSPDTRLGLPLVSTWSNPYRPKASGGSPICSRAVQMVIADPVTSFDSDQLPGAAFPISTSYGAALGASNLNPNKALNVTTEADDIWAKELLPAASPQPAGTLAGSSKKFFMGQTTTTNADGNPTAKDATKFSEMRGHAPDETNTQGSYYAASVAKYGHDTGIEATDGTTKKIVSVDQISVALGTVVPRIEFTYAGKAVTLVPLSKSVGGGSINKNFGQFQPTGLITLMYMDSIYNTHATNMNVSINSGRPYVRFMVSFSDMDQGGDNEADANVYYTLSVDAAGKLVVQLDAYYQAGSIQQNMGFIISGTTQDGVYLGIADEGTSNPIYYLDTLAPPVVATQQNPAPAGGRTNTVHLDKSATFTFTLGAVTGAGTFVPKDPLWYAAKHGGAGVFDSNNDPTNYFKVTNPANLPVQMGKAFRSAAALAAVASTSVVGVGQRSLGTAAIYQANYDSLTWSSRLYAFSVLGSGTVSNSTIWEASSLLPPPATRPNLYLGRGGSAMPFPLTSGNYSLLSSAGSPSEQTDFGSADTYEYILGDKTKEERKGGGFRNRGTTAAAEYGSVLGDIVNSDPQIISKKDYGYAAGDSSYTSFLSSITTESLAVSSNDGFFHIFDASPTATGGQELLGFMPQAARAGIKDLASPSYSHRYFVDGSIGVGHAKIVVPGSAPADSVPNWRTVAVAAGGAGAQTVFAVEVTRDPARPLSANSVLWEINSSTTLPIASTLGNVMGRPVIGKLKNGTWVAIFGNGFNSTVGTANLFVVRLSDGVILKEIPTNALVLGNGLGSTEVVMTTSGNKDTIDYVYGADFKGNIWRFDLSSTSLSSWPATAALVYRTPTGRPITAEIKVGDSPSVPATLGGKMIYFGTGSYLNAANSTDTTVQALYGIYDDLLWTLNSSPAVVETNLTVSTISMVNATDDVRTTSTQSTPWYSVAGKKGWVLPLTGTNVTAGERVIAAPVRYTVPGKVDAFLFTSIVPGTDDCVSGVDAWITGVDAQSGGYKAVFDGLLPNSVKVVGGSPRGVFVLQDGADPTLYISQTLFSGVATSTSYSTSAGGQQTVNINGTEGRTQILGIKLTKQTPGVYGNRQVWRQLK